MHLAVLNRNTKAVAVIIEKFIKVDANAGFELGEALWKNKVCGQGSRGSRVGVDVWLGE